MIGLDSGVRIVNGIETGRTGRATAARTAARHVPRVRIGGKREETRATHRLRRCRAALKRDRFVAASKASWASIHGMLGVISVSAAVGAP